MFSWLWHTFFFDPVYNGLVFFIDTVPGGDVGLAIVGITLLVKVILLPLSIKAAKTQRVMKEIEPQLREIKEKFKDQREEQARAMMAVYKKAGLNPFASVALIFIQLPIVIALYYAVAQGGGVALPSINVDLLYSFIPVPSLVDMTFLDLVDITEKSLILAALAAITQFAHGQLVFPKLEPKAADAPPSFKDDFARSMQVQVKYVMPIIIFVVAYSISAAIALYFFVSNLATLGQEYFVRKHR